MKLKNLRTETSHYGNIANVWTRPILSAVVNVINFFEEIDICQKLRTCTSLKCKHLSKNNLEMFIILKLSFCVFSEGENFRFPPNRVF